MQTPPEMVIRNLIHSEVTVSVGKRRISPAPLITRRLKVTT